MKHTLQTFREEYPEYSELTDEQLVRAYRRTYHPEMPEEDFRKEFLRHDFDALQTIRNIPSSGGRYVDDIYDAITSPVDTLAGIGKLLAGAAQKLDTSDVIGTQFEDTADAALDDVTNKYGSVDSFKRTLQNDPVGTIADLSLLVGGAGAGLKGARLSKVGNQVRKVGANLDPLAVLANTVRTAAKPVIPKRLPNVIMEKGIGFKPATANYLLRHDIPVTEAGMQKFKKQIPPPKTKTVTQTRVQDVDTGILDSKGKRITRPETVTETSTLVSPPDPAVKRIQGELANAIKRNPDYKGTITDLATGSGTGGVIQGATGVPGLAAAATAATVLGRLGAHPHRLGDIAHWIKRLKNESYLAQYLKANPTKLRDLRNALAAAGETQEE